MTDHNKQKKSDVLETLRQEIRKMEGFKLPSSVASMQFGIPDIDNSFPNNSLPLGTTHEFISDSFENTASTVSFVASVVSKINQMDATILWVSKSRMLYPHGLIPFGIDPDRLVFIQVSKDKEALWTLEEALRTKGILAVVGEIGDADQTATRRLQLAVEKSGTTGFLLRIKPKQEVSSVCVTRWRIKPIPSLEKDNLSGVGTPRWNITLEKVRHGSTGQWDLEWTGNQFRLFNQKPLAKDVNVTRLNRLG